MHLSAPCLHGFRVGGAAGRGGSRPYDERFAWRSSSPARIGIFYVFTTYAASVSPFSGNMASFSSLGNGDPWTFRQGPCGASDGS